jgi:hypothetical protein
VFFIATTICDTLPNNYLKDLTRHLKSRQNPQLELINITSTMGGAFLHNRENPLSIRISIS